MSDCARARDGRDATEHDGDAPLDRRKRLVREVLRDRANPVTVGVLTDAVRRRERSDARAKQSDRKARPRRADVHEDLVTRVLPAMQTAGTVVFDERRGTVRAVGPLRAWLVGVTAAFAARSGRLLAWLVG